MLNYKFIQILRTFKKEELSLFKQFLASPIYNTNKKVNHLFTILKKFHPHYSQIKLTKDFLHCKLYPGKSYKDKRLRDLSTEMLFLTESFLAYKTREVNSIDKEIDIIRELNDRGLENIVFTKYNKLSTSLNSIQFKNQALYLQLIKLNDIIKENKYYSHISIQKNLIISATEMNLNIEYLVLIALNLLLENIFIEEINLTKRDLTLINLISNYAEDFQYDNSTIKLYKDCLELLTKKNRKLYNELKETYLSSMPGLDIVTISLLRSTLTLFNMNNKPQFMDESYYKEQLTILGPPDEHLFAGYIRDNVFNNYVINYLYSGDLSGCLKFINDCGKYLKATERARIVNFNLSKYFLFSGYYQDALEHASKCNQRYWWYFINSQCTVIISYYELRDYNNVSKFSTKLHKYINNHPEIPQMDSVSMINFLTCIGYLIDKTKDNNKKIDAIIDILQNNRVNNSKWIQMKISKLQYIKKSG